MRRGLGIVLTVFVILAGVAVAVVAYNVGVDAGTERAVEAAGENAEVVRVVGDGWRRGPGFFGFLLFPFLFFGFFLLLAAFRPRRGPWGPGPGPWGHHAGWHEHMDRQAEEWHRRQHTDESAGSA